MSAASKARRRLLRAERDALCELVRTPGVYRPRQTAHRQLIKRELIREQGVDIHHTATKVGTDDERRTSTKVHLFVLTLRGLQVIRQLRINRDSSARDL